MTALPDRARGPGGTFIRSIETAQRDGEAARLRSLGHGYADIAAQLGIDQAAAWRAVQRAFAATAGEHSEAARRLELDRIDRYLRKAEAILDDPGPQVDRVGRAVRDPVTGEVRPDRMTQLQALDRLTRLLERRAKVIGSDAPKRSVSVTATLDGIPDADRIAYAQERLAAERAALAAEEAKQAIAGEVVADDE